MGLGGTIDTISSMSRETEIITDQRAKLLPRLSGSFFDKPWLTAGIWVVLVVFGILSYTTLLKRQGFPSVNIPVVIVNGTYAVNDPARMDQELGQPIAKVAAGEPEVKSVNVSSMGNFFTAVVQYQESTNTAQAKARLKQDVSRQVAVPKDAELTYSAPYFGVTGGSVQKIDATIALYDTTQGMSEQQLAAQAKKASDYLNAQPKKYVDKYFIDNPFQEVVNPLTGRPGVVQRNFDRYVVNTNGVARFYPSVVIDVAAVNGADVIKLDNEIQKTLGGLTSQPGFEHMQTAITASYAPQIKSEISELQRVLIEGLIAVLIVGSVVIAVRASLITVISMVTVIAIALGFIYIFGYTLNVITLFALILSLSLIVDDTIIMVEALDIARRHNTDRRLAVREAVQKIGRAMIAATMTATLSFVPLLFVSGVLGNFVRAIPVTIIVALLVSLFGALLFIPLFSRRLLLSPKQMKVGEGVEGLTRVEVRIAQAITRPMRWAKQKRRRELLVGSSALVVGLLFIVAGLAIARNVAFNIFPPTKDTDQLAVTMTFPAGTTVQQAEQVAAKADTVTAQVLGDNLRYASYYGLADTTSATLYINLKPYSQRSVTAPQLAKQIDAKLSDMGGAKVDAHAVDIAPSSSGFNVNITANDRPAAIRLAADMAHYLESVQLIRPNGTQAGFSQVGVSNTDIYKRVDGTPVVTVSAVFNAPDTSELTTLARKAVDDHYTGAKLAQFNLPSNAIHFDIGQESENQSSFKTLLFAFPVVLLAIYILLFIEFRSWLQPLLIFMALPFSFFGIALGLWLTNNAFSFFAMLGFFALIGLSIKNTILLTDYANQARRAGMTAIDATIGALGERFRPLVATSFTAVFSLIPLAVTSPFWQGLAVVLIFGLLSSTLLVIFIFPYYYLGGEYLRLRSGEAFRRRFRK